MVLNNLGSDQQSGSGCHSHQEMTLNEGQLILYKLSYLTLMILNMAFMNEKVQENFKFDQDISQKAFDFMDKKLKDITFCSFVKHMQAKREAVDSVK